jgi:hypothetical protein
MMLTSTHPSEDPVRHPWLPRISFAVAAAATTFFGASAAWAAGPSDPPLHQDGEHIVASNSQYDHGAGNCGVTQLANQDAWVFVWNGGEKSVGTVESVHIGWDTDGDINHTADQFLDYPGPNATQTEDNGTPKIVFLTPAGWKLESGTSHITGETANNDFNLTHTCSGTPSETKSPTDTPSSHTSSSNSNPPGSSTTDPGEHLPVTGAPVGGFVLTGVALIAFGAALLFARWWRDRREA